MTQDQAEERAESRDDQEPVAPDATSPTITPNYLWDLLVGIIPLIAITPMLLFESAAFWSRDYMRFVPVTLLALGLIVGLGWPKAVETENPYRRWTAIGLLIVAALIYLYSGWEFSPWLSHLAITVVFCAWALGRFGNRHWATVVAWTALLATTIRLPWNWDEGILGWIDGLAAWGTTKAMDALSIPCLNNGTLVETRGLSLVADEVCGGWGSLFAFVSFAVFILIVQHRSAFVSVIVLCLVPLWTLLGSFLRLLTISLTFEYYAHDLSGGWDFRLLALATDGLVLVIIWMSTNLFARLLEPIPAADAEFGPVFSGLNKLFLWPQPDPIEEEEPEDEYEKRAYLRRKKKIVRGQPSWAPFDWRSNSRAVWLVRFSAVLLLIGLVVPVTRLASQGISDLNFGLPRVPSEWVVAYAEEESLPAELEGGWRRTGFERARRSLMSGFGEFGIVWNYALGDQRFSASIDLPFLGWHDPIAQRKLQGWTVEAERADIQDDWVWCESELENELGGRAYSLYSLYTPESQPYSKLPPRLATDLALRAGTEGAVKEQSDTQVTYQFQVFIESGEQLSRADQQRIRERFLELRESVRSFPKLGTEQAVPAE